MKRDAKLLVARNQVDDKVDDEIVRVVNRWMAWLDARAYDWIDAETITLGARMSLFGDHPFVRELYWSEWIAKPWYKARSDASKLLCN